MAGWLGREPGTVSSHEQRKQQDGTQQLHTLAKRVTPGLRKVCLAGIKKCYPIYCVLGYALLGKLITIQELHDFAVGRWWVKECRKQDIEFLVAPPPSLSRKHPWEQLANCKILGSDKEDTSLDPGIAQCLDSYVPQKHSLAKISIIM